jgi:hypothetical protein
MAMREIARGSVVPFAVTLAPGASQSFPQAGDWFMVAKCNIGTMMLSRDQDSTGNNLKPGDIWIGSYQSFTLTNQDVTRTASLTVYAGTGEPPERVTPYLVKTQVNSQSDVACGAGALTQIISAASNQKRVLLQVASGAVGPLRIGGATTSATKGVLLNVGLAPLAIEGSGDIYAWNPNASAVTVTSTIEV